MKYPNIDAENTKKQIFQDNGKSEAKLYVQSESFNEFSMKREVAGIKHAFFSFNDYFRMFYFHSNGRRSLYYAKDWEIPLQVILLLLSGILLVVFGITVSIGCYVTSLSFLTIALLSLSFTIIYHRSVISAYIAKKFLEDIDSQQKYDL